MADDFITHVDSELSAYAQTFVDYATANLAHLGLAAGDLTPISTAKTGWDMALADAESKDAAARVAHQGKDAAKKTLVEALRTVTRKIQAHPATTNADRTGLGITVRDTVRTSIAAPTDAPLLTLDFAVRGRMTIHFGPNPNNEKNNGLPKGSAGVMLQYIEGSGPAAETDWQWLANDSNSPYVHVVNDVKPRTFSYRAAYINRKNEQGPWSGPVTGTITP